MFKTLSLCYNVYQTPKETVMKAANSALTYELHQGYFNTPAELCCLIGMIGSLFFSLTNSNNLWSGKTLAHFAIFVSSSTGLLTALFLKMHTREMKALVEQAENAKKAQRELFGALDQAAEQRANDRQALQANVETSVANTEETHAELTIFQRDFQTFLSRLHQIKGLDLKAAILSMQEQLQASIPTQQAMEQTLERAGELADKTQELINLLQNRTRVKPAIFETTPLELVREASTKLRTIKQQSETLNATFTEVVLNDSKRSQNEKITAYTSLKSQIAQLELTDEGDKALQQDSIEKLDQAIAKLQPVDDPSHAG